MRKVLAPTSTLAALALMLGATAQADTVALDNGQMTYEIFEHSVGHVDLATCPEGFDNDKVFCRLTVAEERAHVFAFAFEGDQLLQAIRSYEFDEEFLNF
ncbi:MAG: hypothetical protein HLUCCO07_02925 [Rhodobacteraceae bacterium HLUCCO07]|nr:MAG: hypothetical protein HLUCCO07_02925 [Rhodobacteraceae bacterium HLUCCO07]